MTITSVEIRTAVAEIKASTDKYRAENVLVVDQPWQTFANCLGTNPDNFSSEQAIDITAAKAICAECVVIEPCLEFALRFNTPTRLKRSDDFSTTMIWGGKTLRERRTINRARRGLSQD